MTHRIPLILPRVSRGALLLPTGEKERGYYSTVTDFARLRGWSTSVPMKTAAW